jgi:hypothetical protein
MLVFMIVVIMVIVMIRLGGRCDRSRLGGIVHGPAMGCILNCHDDKLRCYLR